ncbi:hypothetical protein ADEAN_000141500 [Angomonas deanei]|uniref:Uncharacterized protein n=1 Tax=Angomonas deanei TaxID=59799 RepID=A0A7G2C461_9TRYP|nr:hypothetical protein ADEAN_000141500 [Angomonas deanei]
MYAVQSLLLLCALLLAGIVRGDGPLEKQCKETASVEKDVLEFMDDLMEQFSSLKSKWNGRDCDVCQYPSVICAGGPKKKDMKVAFQLAGQKLSGRQFPTLESSTIVGLDLSHNKDLSFPVSKLFEEKKASLEYLDVSHTGVTGLLNCWGTRLTVLKRKGNDKLKTVGCGGLVYADGTAATARTVLSFVCLLVSLVGLFSLFRYVVQWRM